MNETVHVGHTGNDEMCNLYLMFYADVPTAMTCFNERLSIHTGVRAPSLSPCTPVRLLPPPRAGL
jgi:hypothetical protein